MQRIMKNTEELYRIQEEIASKAVIEDELNLEELNVIAGADQAFLYKSKSENGIKKEKIISAVVLLEYPSMKFIDYAYSVLPVDFPYIPGLLSFREAPAIINAFYTLKTRPDLLVIDGGGINHPRFAGLATHVGVSLDVATIGVAKSLLCGTGEVPEEEGESRIIKYHDRAVGYYLRSKKGCKPIIVAPGHKISLKTSLKLIKNASQSFNSLLTLFVLLLTCLRPHLSSHPMAFRLVAVTGDCPYFAFTCTLRSERAFTTIRFFLFFINRASGSVRLTAFCPLLFSSSSTFLSFSSISLTSMPFTIAMTR